MKEIQEWLGHSAISTTADIYSHLNYSSKLNVANTLTNAFGGGKLKVEEQNPDEAKALLTTLFRGAEHERARDDSDPVETATEEVEPIFEEESKKTNKSSYGEVFEDVDDSIAEYKKAKEEMARLGFTDYDEYLDYLRAARKNDMEM